FGRNFSATFGEQLILQDSVTQSINSPGASVTSAGAAALAAGERLLLFGVACGGTVPGAGWFASGTGLGSSCWNKPPDVEHPARASRNSSLANCLIDLFSLMPLRSPSCMRHLYTHAV